jgi:DNA polymerase (family 10)
MDNRTVADHLTRHADLLVREGENLYRVRAYRRAAQTILALEQPVRDLVARSGSVGLAALPGIGEHLAYTLEQLVLTGELVPHPRSRSATRLRCPQARDRGSKVA